ncbi:MAG: hypothetical protein KF777_10445 [Planctomycetaceae bacterium]|nr:hypothetical protein [Planctomycetaceae bacterium]
MFPTIPISRRGQALAAAACLALLTVGCNGKIPTWGELTGQQQQQQPVQPQPTIVQPPPITSSQPAPPDASAIIATFKTTAPQEMSDSLLGTVANLPERREEIEEILAGGSQVTDNGLKQLSALPNLRTLDVLGTKVTNEGVASIAKITSLESLRFTGQQLKDDGAAELAKMPNLRKLYIDNVALSPTGWAAIGRIPSLEVLHVSHSSIGDAAMPLLCEAQNLKEFVLHYSGVSDVGVSYLGKLPHLQKLEISGCSVTGEGLLKAQSGSGLSQLKSLGVWGCPLNERGGQAIAQMKNLEDLNLGHNPSIQDVHAIAIVKGKKELRYLKMHGNPLLTDRTLVAMKGLPKLEFLDMGETRVSDQGLMQLTKMESLKELRVGDTNVSPAGLTKLCEALPLLVVPGFRGQGGAVPTWSLE